MRKPVTPAQKQEAVALASVVGAEAAAERLGWDRRTIRKWSEQAGNRPELDTPSDDLQRLYDLAVARVTVDVAEGKIKGSALMTVVGIARDKLDRAARWKAARERLDPDTPPPSSTPLTDAAYARYNEWHESLELTERRALYRYLRHVRDEIDAADAADDQPEDERTDEEGEAGWDRFLADCQAELPEIVAWGIADEQRERDRVEQCKKAGRWLDDETCDLLIEAERVLAEEVA